MAEFDKLLIEISKKDLEANEGFDRQCLAETIIHAHKNIEPGLEHLTERQVNAIPGVAFSGAVETTAVCSSLQSGFRVCQIKRYILLTDCHRLHCTIPC